MILRFILILKCFDVFVLSYLRLKMRCYYCYLCHYYTKFLTTNLTLPVVFVPWLISSFIVSLSSKNNNLT